jgi:hypothetical protein
LNDLVHAVIEEQKAGLEKIDVKLSLMPYLPEVQGDTRQLKRVIEISCVMAWKPFKKKPRRERFHWQNSH